MTRKRILSISFSPLRRDARMLRQFAVLAELGELTTVGYGAAPDGVDHHIEVPERAASLPQTVGGVARLALHRFASVELRAPGERAVLPALRAEAPFDLVIANDARALPLAFAVAGDAPVWADLHEWAPEENSTVLSWRLLVGPYMEYLCEKYLGRAAATTTVSQTIAELYATHYGVHPEIVRNAGPWQDLTPSALIPDRIRLVHSGIAVPERNIEALIDAVHRLDERFTLDLFLVGTDRYVGALRARARGSERITFHPAVLPAELPATLNRFDIGVYLLQLRSLNHRLMLPNKFFDFVQARVGIVMSPALETARLIAENGIGPALPSTTLESLINTLSALTPEAVAAYKAGSDRAARTLSSDSDTQTMRALVQRLLGEPLVA